jgi:hypothetical protein
VDRHGGELAIDECVYNQPVGRPSAGASLFGDASADETLAIY